MPLQCNQGYGVLFSLAIAMALAAGVWAQPPPPVQPFGAFIAGVQAARPTAFVGQPGFAVESAAAFAEMRAHVLELYRGVTARNSFVGPDRQIVDCIPIDQQPGLRPSERPRAGVSSDAPVAPKEDIPPKGSRQDRTAKQTSCQTGTIPMRRLTLERMATFRTLAAFLSK